MRLSISRTSPNQTAIRITRRRVDLSSGSSVPASTTSTYSSFGSRLGLDHVAGTSRASCAGVALAGCRSVDGCLDQRLRDHDRGRTVLGREADVAARQRQPVRLARPSARRRSRRQVEVGDHPAHDRQLLEVLLTEHRHVGRGGVEAAWSTTVVTPLEVPGSHPALEPIGEPAGHDAGVEQGRVHRGGGRGVDGVDAGDRQAARSSSIGRG